MGVVVWWSYPKLFTSFNTCDIFLVLGIDLPFELLASDIISARFASNQLFRASLYWLLGDESFASNHTQDFVRSITVTQMRS